MVSQKAINTLRNKHSEQHPAHHKDLVFSLLIEAPGRWASENVCGVISIRLMVGRTVHCGWRHPMAGILDCINRRKWGLQDGSVGKGTHWQAWQTEFYPWDLLGGRREPESQKLSMANTQHTYSLKQKGEVSWAAPVMWAGASRCLLGPSCLADWTLTLWEKNTFALKLLFVRNWGSWQKWQFQIKVLKIKRHPSGPGCGVVPYASIPATERQSHRLRSKFLDRQAA